MRAAAFTLIALLATATAADASRQDARQQRIAEAHPAGAPVGCIQINRIRSSRVLDDRTIDFEMNGGQVLRNTLPNSCPTLGFEESFSYKTSLSQLCSVDIITVLRHDGPGLTRGASCGLGKFQPVTFPDHRR